MSGESTQNDKGAERCRAAVRLLQVCRDCESALRAAAEVAESRRTGDEYRRRAQAWARFCASLEGVIARRGGGGPARSPTVRSILRRAWIKIQSAIDDSDAIAAECLNQEAEARRCCSDIIREDSDAELCRVVQRFLVPFATPC